MGFELKLHKLFSYSPNRCDIAVLLSVSSVPSTVRRNNYSFLRQVKEAVNIA